MARAAAVDSRARVRPPRREIIHAGHGMIKHLSWIFALLFIRKQQWRGRERGKKKQTWHALHLQRLFFTAFIPPLKADDKQQNTPLLGDVGA